MEQLPKETIERIEKEARGIFPRTPVDELPLSGTDFNLFKEAGYIEGAKSEALRSLSEIEKLKEDYNQLGVKFDKELERWQERDMNELNKRKELESQNKELMEALRDVYNTFSDGEHGVYQNLPTHQSFYEPQWIKKIESLLKSLPNKEA